MRLVVGGIEITYLASAHLRQSYTDVPGGTAEQRMSDGSLRVQTVWPGAAKIKTTINADGWELPGLDGIDFRDSIEIWCVQPRRISSASSSIAIPRAYRTDTEYLPIGCAVVDRLSIATPCTMINGVATLTPVAGATAYNVDYWPIIQAKAAYDDSLDHAGHLLAWTLNAEEI